MALVALYKRATAIKLVLLLFKKRSQKTLGTGHWTSPVAQEGPRAEYSLPTRWTSPVDVEGPRAIWIVVAESFQRCDSLKIF